MITTSGPTVCILTAGKGTRMGTYARKLNKALLPLAGKAVLSHIIDRFPPETEFVIGLGHLGDQVRTYLGMAHEGRPLTFVEVDRFEGPGSGPGYSLSCCRPHLLKPFYFVSCDTLWDGPLDLSASGNWVGVARVPASESARYCNMRITDDRVVEIRDKEAVEGAAFGAFVGLCYIQDHEVFWSALGSGEVIASERQISSGLAALAERGRLSARVVDWMDVGDAEKYKKAVLRFEEFDFSKQDEALYIFDGRVIKFFADPAVAERRVRRSRLNPQVFPAITHHAGQLYTYAFQPGRTLYQANSPAVLRRLLLWLEQSLWNPVTVDRAEVRAVCTRFYKDKTEERLAAYYAKHEVVDAETVVNGERLPTTRALLDAVPWFLLAEGHPAFIHGDLQFDNILHDEATGTFRLLDWRQDFSGKVEYGDLYYDLAKLYGGIVLNYDYIKRNLLYYAEGADGVFFDFAQRYQTGTYLAVLTDYLRQRGYDERKVRILVGLIYLNMAPLHHDPFDRLLYSLGRQTLTRELRGTPEV